MIAVLNLFLRSVLSRKLTWNEVDSNWQQIQNAVNQLLAGNWQNSYDGVEAGELVVVHDYGIAPKHITIWRKISADRWIPVATPEVSYLDSEANEKVRITFSENMGSIKVCIIF